jgi:hypothetical protein
MKQAAYSTQSLKNVMQLQLFAVVGLNLKKISKLWLSLLFFGGLFLYFSFPYYFGYNF